MSARRVVIDLTLLVALAIGPPMAALWYHDYKNRLPDFIAEATDDIEIRPRDRESEDKVRAAVAGSLLRRFPVGTEEHSLIEFLSKNRFVPRSPAPDGAREYQFKRGDLVCGETYTVRWKVDENARLTSIDANYEIVCS